MANDSKVGSRSRDMAALFANPKYSDLEIQCQGKVFSVHRAIVCTRSKVLAAECEGAFKEACDRIVKHEMYDSATMSRMLHFMYENTYATDVETITMARSEKMKFKTAATITDSYVEENMKASISASDTIEASTGKEGSMNAEVALAHVNVYFIADFYDVPDLKSLALRNFEEWGCPIAPEEFAMVLTTIYTHTLERGDPLRRMVASQALLRLPSLLQCTPFMQAVAENHELQKLAADLLPRVHRQVVDRDEQVVILEAELAKSKSEILTAEHKLKDSESAKDKHYREFQEVKALLCKWSACRNCGNVFGSVLDTVPKSGGSTYIIRCCQCLCKHLN